MRSLRPITPTLSLLALVCAGCGGTDQQPEMPDPSVVQRSADDLGLPAPEEGDEGAEEDAAMEPPPSPVRVVAGEREPIEGDAPSVQILRPRDGQTIRGDVSLRLRVRNWELAEAPGRHVHVIVDNEPYIAVRDVSSPIDLNALAQEHLGHELEEGTHVVRVFPSRDHHESVKADGAFDMAVFHVGSESEGFELDADAPMLTYSRPKGCNVAGERILLDFYLSNVELSEDGPRVRYNIDGALTGDITSWVPHWIENLPAMPRHTLQLQLVDAEGEPIEGPFNDTTRTISVAESCD
ncbi:MAG TPA: hypothetical protein RMH99_03930 [Sandaracinaceae bacterium LLY-WYZ-13_1]|nr:hypothetical protein [Sandaracinaceae bacterium LLY-WYZ-13_1]